eukprot:scaffold62054_cov30-Tisochrysis_lutea.AAC.1
MRRAHLAGTRAHLRQNASSERIWREAARWHVLAERVASLRHEAGSFRQGRRRTCPELGVGGAVDRGVALFAPFEKPRFSKKVPWAQASHLARLRTAGRACAHDELAGHYDIEAGDGRRRYEECIIVAKRSNEISLVLASGPPPAVEGARTESILSISRSVMSSPSCLHTRRKSSAEMCPLLVGSKSSYAARTTSYLCSGCIMPTPSDSETVRRSRETLVLRRSSEACPSLGLLFVLSACVPPEAWSKAKLLRSCVLDVACRIAS